MSNGSLSIEHIRDFVEQHEGRRNKVYNDSAGHPTIGVGFNLDRDGAQEEIEALGLNYQDVRNGKVSLTDVQIDTLFHADVNSAVNSARNVISNFDDIPGDKQIVLADMAFNLGEAGLAGFHKMVAAVENEDWATAADEMEDSRWFKQVGDRGTADSDMMREDPTSGS